MEKNIASPKVTVCILAFNHERYIGECVESILLQETNFNVEILISDDGSEDGTWNILKNYADKYKNKIIIYKQEKNIGATKNYIFLHSKARGDYVAHIDGDDYALPGKLQKQHDILERYRDCNVVMHPMSIIESNGKMRASRQLDSKTESWLFTRSDLVRQTWIGAHSSKMYRRLFDHSKLPERSIDFLMTFSELGLGYGCFVCDKAYGVYRESVGISTGSSWTRLTLIQHLNYVHQKYKEHRADVCAAFLYLTLSDVKNMSNTIVFSLIGLVRSFSVTGIILFVKNVYRYKSGKI